MTWVRYSMGRAGGEVLEDEYLDFYTMHPWKGNAYVGLGLKHTNTNKDTRGHTHTHIQKHTHIHQQTHT